MDLPNLDPIERDTATSLDVSTISQLLLSLPYEEVISLAASHPKYQTAINDSTFWTLKLQQDYKKTYNPASPKSPQQQYFEEYDLIRESDGDISEKLWSKLQKIEKTSTNEVRVHFSGEFDSNQTKFETLSNELKLGVIARSKLFARAALRLIRFEVDNNPLYDYAQEIIDEEGDPLTYTNLIKTLAHQESHYGKDYPLGTNFMVKYVGGETLTRDITEIDLWTLGRMDRELGIDVVDLDFSKPSSRTND
ncbi:Hypothetical protein POVR1_LOCUS579 [uncultured virus]|nr:Hypothetical protein POVR1_LOCUS579 [uncultured virus]